MSLCFGIIGFVESVSAKAAEQSGRVEPVAVRSLPSGRFVAGAMAGSWVSVPADAHRLLGSVVLPKGGFSSSVAFVPVSWAKVGANFVEKLQFSFYFSFFSSLSGNMPIVSLRCAAELSFPNRPHVLSARSTDALCGFAAGGFRYSGARELAGGAPVERQSARKPNGFRADCQPDFPVSGKSGTRDVTFRSAGGNRRAGSAIALSGAG